MKRFRLKTLMLLMAIVSLGFWLLREIYNEVIWRPKREELRRWAEEVFDPTETLRQSKGLRVSGRLYVAMTMPGFYESCGLDCTAIYEFPEDAPFEKQSPFGSDNGYFIIPQCI